LTLFQRAKKTAESIFQKIEKREKSIQLVLQAKAFIQFRLGVDIEAYLNDFSGVFEIQESSAEVAPGKYRLILEKSIPK
jgi:hypothetical protein